MVGLTFKSMCLETKCFICPLSMALTVLLVSVFIDCGFDATTGRSNPFPSMLRFAGTPWAPGGQPPRSITPGGGHRGPGLYSEDMLAALCEEDNDAAPALTNDTGAGPASIDRVEGYAANGGGAYHVPSAWVFGSDVSRVAPATLTPRAGRASPPLASVETPPPAGAGAGAAIARTAHPRRAIRAE